MTPDMAISGTIISQISFDHPRPLDAKGEDAHVVPSNRNPLVQLGMLIGV